MGGEGKGEWVNGNYVRANPMIRKDTQMEKEIAFCRNLSYVCVSGGI